jgi:hypothetical protein
MYSFVLVALLAANPMTLAQIEAEALATNPEIQSAVQQIRIAESRLGSALAVDDPQFGYRGWSTPLLQPWDLNQTQHMFMLTENVPAPGKRAMKFLIASDDAEIQALALESKKREIAARVHQAFYRLLRTYDQLRIHHSEVTLAEQTIEATRIQYRAGKVPQKDVLEAGVAYSRLAEHEIMVERDADGLPINRSKSKASTESSPHCRLGKNSRPLLLGAGPNFSPWKRCRSKARTRYNWRRKACGRITRSPPATCSCRPDRRTGMVGLRNSR